MDRVIRPSGFIIIRDKQVVIDYVKKHLVALHWEVVDSSSTKQDHDGEDGVLIGQKKLRLTSESLRDTE
ncbi:unnamed protein product [Linum trigynum]|uniref:Methyltransferase n=1 Tax=Linum trigynum TaxID=586398 RepID=A0AAV2GJY1_9ROSI